MEDVDTSIRVMLESFTQAQRQSVKLTLRKSFNRFIIYKRDHDELLIHLLEEVIRDHPVQVSDKELVVPCDDFERKARYFYSFCQKFKYANRKKTILAATWRWTNTLRIFTMEKPLKKEDSFLEITIGAVCDLL